MSKENKHIEDPDSMPGFKSWNRGMTQGVVRIILLIAGLVILFFLLSCSFSYKFEGGSINYDVTKTINIQEFPNRSPLVFPQLAQIFDQKLRDRYIEQTRLKPVDNNADIEISGEITRFDIQGLAVKEDTYASQTRLTISIHVQYVNNKEQNQDVDQTFSAFREFDSSLIIDDVQDELCRNICDDIVDQIYNATVANW